LQGPGRFACDYYCYALIMPSRSKRSAADASAAHEISSINSRKKAASSTNNNKKKVNSALQQEQGDEGEARPWYHSFTKGDAEYDAYMGAEWGMECRTDDRRMLEVLSLEGAQSGLSWRTILTKRAAYRRDFFDFDADRIVAAAASDNDDEAVVERIVAYEGETNRDNVVRHRGKIRSVLGNARCVVELQRENPSVLNPLCDYLWSFVDDRPILNRRSISQAPPPSKSAESEAMSRALKRRGFKFVGPTTCYSLMQAVGMVIDHPVDSPEWTAAHERLRNRPGGYQER
jgi:DNA-3-methyladenine glycosylase I